MGFIDTIRSALGAGGSPERSTGFKLRSWRPELPDPRDHIYKPSMPGLPTQVAPLGSKTRVHDQGQTSSCTGHAATAMLETRLGLTGDSGQLSRLFPYYLGREAIGETAQDAGAYNRDVIKSMMKAGVPRETLWRFSATNVTKRPSVNAYHDAELQRQRVEAMKLVYERVTSLDALLDALARGNPVMFGFLAYAPIFDLNGTNHVLPLPGAGEQPVGGHAVMADGFIMSERVVWVQNSWGTAWGKRGYFKMPFEWFTSPARLVDDMWTLRPTA